MSSVERTVKKQEIQSSLNIGASSFGNKTQEKVRFQHRDASARARESSRRG
jgi:hypothetical protein